VETSIRDNIVTFAAPLACGAATRKGASLVERHSFERTSREPAGVRWVRLLVLPFGCNVGGERHGFRVAERTGERGSGTGDRIFRVDIVGDAFIQLADGLFRN
jgi:hypothetical protein